MIERLRSIARRVLRAAAAPGPMLGAGELCFALMGLRGRARPLSEARRVLVVRCDQMGDVVLTTPLLRELRRNLPHAWITLVVGPGAYHLLALCPYVNELLCFETEASAGTSPLRPQRRALSLASKRLWRRGFDLCLLPRWDDDTSHARVLAYLSGARRRVGYSSGQEEDLFLTDPLPREPAKPHEVDRTLDLLRALGGSVAGDGLELWLGQDDVRWARRRLARAEENPGGPLIVLGIGARAAKRRWPVERYAELGQSLLDHGATLVAVGGAEDRPDGQRLYQALTGRLIDLTGKATPRQTAAVLGCCDLFIGNDSGPMHLAAAVGAPVVEVSCHPRGGPVTHANSPVRFGPRGVPSRILQPDAPIDGCGEGCRASEPHCILGVSVEAVLRAAVEFLDTRSDHQTTRHAA